MKHTIQRSPFQSRYGFYSKTLQVIKHPNGDEWRGLIQESKDSIITKEVDDVVYRFHADAGWVIFLTNQEIKLRFGKNRVWYWEASDKARRKILSRIEEYEIKKADKAAEKTISGANI